MEDERPSMTGVMTRLNVFGYDDYYYGDGVMDRLPPNSIAHNYPNLSAPPYPALAWALIVDDATLEWTLEPHGHAFVSATMYGLLCSLSLITGVLAVVIFVYSFYGIRHNLYGVQTNSGASKYSPIIGLLNKSAADFKESVTPIAEKIFGHKPNAEIVGWLEDKNKRRRVLIATLEYEIIDWKLKVKIGGLGVIPKVKDLDYPAGEPAEPIEVIIFNEPYRIEVETHVLDNITYVILDRPVFHAQTTSDPYPARMDDLIPVCLSLHNAEFQGLWPLRTKEEMKEVCSAFNISKEHCMKYVQFGNMFNLLHAAASFISVHQKSMGVAGVLDKYGKRSWVWYPALWTLEYVDSLPNPDPADIAALDENLVAICEVQIDQVVKAQRPEMKRQAQEWANIKQDPTSGKTSRPKFR
ncbi:uncharacterized protein HD556DRAFT_1535307 [Suillus plorans]|uniref:Mok11-13/Ags1-like CBM domain-containing protein n=1 Tax=Suillus plorans TaxID=116603 RepID=A0A9P7DKL3_9AGAM|nr:uncharacterized protein HD556DRAFT_1535307 [Suillus plorans]KAG1797120.1 hypothetical protein HD556DRAFT_1535307 [Suillus plorans]